MDYRCLGRTGLQVSEIGLGTVELGLDYGVPVAGEHLRPPEEQAGASSIALSTSASTSSTPHGRMAAAKRSSAGRSKPGGTSTSWPASWRRSRRRARRIEFANRSRPP